MDDLLNMDVDGAGGVVEQEDGWVDEQRPGDGDPLALAAREGVAPFAHHGVVALGEITDEPVGIGRCRCSDDLISAGIRSAIGDVVGDRG